MTETLLHFVKPTAHAKRFPPSSLSAIEACNGYQPSSESSEAAREGTAAHELAQDCLVRGIEAYELVNTKYVVEDQVFEVTPDMARFIQEGYVNPILELAQGYTLRVEQKLALAPVTGEVATGTADAVILKDRALTIADLKYGMHRVEAQGNSQLLAYALAAVSQYEKITGPIEHVDLMIFQPRLKHVSEWRVSRFDLEAWGVRLAIMIDRIQHGAITLNPGASQCKYCAKAATCEALNESIFEAASVDFDSDQEPTPPSEDDDELLAKKLRMVGLIKTWAEAVETESRKRLMAGRQLRGFKVVEGRRGARKWIDEVEAESAMKGMRIRHKDMYEQRLITPTTAEKYAKWKRIGPTQWRKLSALLTQTEGKPSVVEESDPRPALVTDPAEDFSANS